MFKFYHNCKSVLNNIDLNNDQVYEGSVAHRNNVSPCDAVYALNGTPLECFKQVCCVRNAFCFDTFNSVCYFFS